MVEQAILNIGTNCMRWMFSATGHRKNACDAVGELLKHQASLRNLRSGNAAPIRWAHEMVFQLRGSLKNVALLHAPGAAIEEHRQKSAEWKSVPRVPEIRSWHVWMYARDQSSGHALSVARTAASKLTVIKH